MRIPECRFVGDRRHFILQSIRGKKVLHLGCTEASQTTARLRHGSHLHIQMAGVAIELWGVDIDPSGLQLLREAGIGNLVEGSVYDLGSLPIPHDFDVVVAGELLEHLANPGLFLAELRRVCSSTTTVLLTTPNCYSIKQFIHALLGEDAVDATHTAVYGFSTLNTLLTCSGFQVASWHTATNTQLTWRSRVATGLLSLAARACPGLSDSLVVECRLREA